MDYTAVFRSLRIEFCSSPQSLSYIVWQACRELVQSKPPWTKAPAHSFFVRTLASLIKRGATVCESEPWREDVGQIFSMQRVRAACCCSPFWSPPEVFPASLLSAEEQRSNENHLVMNRSSRRTSEWLTHRQWPRAKKSASTETSSDITNTRMYYSAFSFCFPNVLDNSQR